MSLPSDPLPPPATAQMPKPKRLSLRLRSEIIVAIGEFCGTFLFLFMSFGAAQNALVDVPGRNGDASSRLPNAPTLLFIAAASGASVAINVWIFFRVSGGLFNPAVSLGLALIGAITPIRAALVTVAQIVAAICAAAAVDGLWDGPLAVTNTLGAGIHPVQGLFIEMFLTCQLMLAIYLLAVEKHRATWAAPIGIGLSVFVASMVGVASTGAGLNPARSFGPAVIAGFVDYHWIYWVGPLLGTLLSWAIYKGLKLLVYTTANPGHDDDGLELELVHYDGGRATVRRQHSSQDEPVLGKL